VESALLSTDATGEISAELLRWRHRLKATTGGHMDEAPQKALDVSISKRSEIR